MSVVAELATYGAIERDWLDRVGGHYLQNATPGCLFAIGVRDGALGLVGDIVGDGPLLGLCLVGRPTARRIAQDGSIGEITRMVLVPGLPKGTASMVLRRAIEIATARGMTALIAYHDRTRHSGCIYKKAGFKRDGVVKPKPHAWGSRPGRKSKDYEPTSKRRWRIELTSATARR
jgi:hypothetical protein